MVYNQSIYQKAYYQMILDTNSHSVFLLNYHLILATKYRREVFEDAVSDRAKAIFERISPDYKIEVIEWNYEKDHVHILFKAHPKSELSKFINTYKSASSRLLKKEFAQIKTKLWEDKFWSQSFCLITTGGAPLEVIKQYIIDQGK